jgi:hypothetical protein
MLRRGNGDGSGTAGNVKGCIDWTRFNRIDQQRQNFIIVKLRGPWRISLPDG